MGHGMERHCHILAQTKGRSTPHLYCRYMIDLHTHSNFSDGSDSPAELAQKAHDLGISAIALTDHDTTLSHEEMQAACDRLGMELIPGFEVSLRDDQWLKRLPDGTEKTRSVHVLAYFVPLEPAHPLQRKLELLRHDRDVRNKELVAVLNGLGFEKLTLDYLIGLAKNQDSIGRPHFAQAMINLHPEIVGEKTDESWARIFIEWLGNDGKAYVPKMSINIEEFTDAAKGTSTVFSIAHPLVNYLSDSSAGAIETTMPKVLASLRERGFKGVEAYYGSTDQATRSLMVKLTRDAGMIPTGGSDYHGTYKTDVKLGFGKSGDLRVPNEVLDELKAAR
jgi:predicted metal-dependent phosphoesterase TrpH